MAWKTRKNRGGSLANLFRKKTAPLSSQTNSINKTVKNNSISYGRKGSETNFIAIKKKKAMVAKMVRNHVAKLKSLNEKTRNESMMLMNDAAREKAKILLGFPTFNSLSNDQVVELYTTGKVRSQSV